MKIVLFLLLSMAALLGGCAAPVPQPPAGERAAADAAPTPPQKHRAPPMSNPYPPREARPAVALDVSCTRSSDCAVKNVGNCCGAMPACVNNNSRPNPDAVRAQCEASGMMSICGFQDIRACQCVSGRCEPESSSLTDAPATR